MFSETNLIHIPKTFAYDPIEWKRKNLKELPISRRSSTDEKSRYVSLDSFQSSPQRILK